MQLATEAPGVDSGRLSPGRAGTAETLGLMRSLVARGSRDPFVKLTALNVLNRAGVHAHDSSGEIRALFKYVQRSIRFTRDAYNIEQLQHPRNVIQWGAGDCDCRAILLASLLGSIGHPAQLRFRAIGADPRRPRHFSHVYLVARMNGRDVALDPTWAWSDAGWQHPNPTSVADVGV